MFVYEKFNVIPQIIKDDSLIQKLKNKIIQPYQFYGTQLSASDSNWIRIKEDFKFITILRRMLDRIIL